MIDWTRVDDLRNEVGDEDMIEIAEIFLDEMSETIDPIRTGQRPTSVTEALHFLKGASLNVGFHDLATACANAEKAGDPEDLSAIVRLFDLSRAEFLSGLNQLR